MTSHTSVLPGRSARLEGWHVDLLVALCATLAVVALQAIQGFPTLAGSHGDNDSLLRLVEIRDLMAGQGWFDLHQYRMGAPGGFVMHWSRLVDAPVAAIILLGSVFTGDRASGEIFALIVWPTLLLGLALFFIMRSARVFAGPSAQLPALLIGVTSLYYIGVFAPAALDHHNLQLVLTLATIFFLLNASRRDGLALGMAAGACTSLLLAVAIEAVLYVAVAGAWVALWCLVDPAHMRRTAIGFGLVFAGAAAAVFVVTVPVWSAAQCDAFSLPQAGSAVLSGLGLAAIAAASLPTVSMTRRMILFAVLAVALACLLVIFFPQCLADPYASLDPRLQSWWLGAITEAQPVWRVVATDPSLAAGHYGPPLVALACLVAAIRRSGPRRDTTLVASLLGAAFLISLWQIRGSVFAIAIAVIPLSAFVAGWRQRAADVGSPLATARMAGAWLVSLCVVWSAAAGAIAGAPAAGSASVESAAPAGSCENGRDFDLMASMPAAGVLTISNLGAAVLRHTPHRVLAGPYHRNIAGNLAMLDAFAGPATRAEEIARANGVTLVALCRGNGETSMLAERAPDGLVAALLRGEVPAWLEIIPESRDAPIELYRVLPAA